VNAPGNSSTSRRRSESWFFRRWKAESSHAESCVALSCSYHNGSKPFAPRKGLSTWRISTTTNIAMAGHRTQAVEQRTHAVLQAKAGVINTPS
jgi:hypothetical protein